MSRLRSRIPQARAAAAEISSTTVASMPGTQLYLPPDLGNVADDFRGRAIADGAPLERIHRPQSVSFGLAL
ncbi:hypothetical protein GCM10017567_13710 [Amycolatopsis bullii]|uniref:Uncharacterized protein n=1 Tax=Amycolatopsis bullii TaxID=941987 RepID=A0ABQ3K352_9PSEU|nr:hypothetical protein GCM10017567_13710 [Amycolatopsis bullii]